MAFRKSTVLAIGILFVLLSACDKLMDTSPEKLPARLKFEFAIDECEIIDTKDGNASGGNNNQSKFTIDRGFLSIENMEFDGRRQHGATNVYFISDFSETVKLNQALKLFIR